MLQKPEDYRLTNMDDVSCHSKRMTGNRRRLLQVGIGIGGMLLAGPASLLFRSEAAGRTRAVQAEVATISGRGSLEELMALALQHEHGAMIQYANHAGLLSHWINPIFATSIQDIIADEVEHTVTLVNALAVRGLTPTLAVWPPRSGDQARELILMDIAAEQGAVELYTQMLEHDLDPTLRTAITSIRDAEILHRNIFNDLLEKV
ncbi:MAG: ferritin-like domain-containing protein [Desulfovibrionales bacterium]|nr:MAG: ferritin-like domain-containing protein [Desulfovibrionales bacterium]